MWRQCFIFILPHFPTIIIIKNFYYLECLITILCCIRSFSLNSVHNFSLHLFPLPFSPNEHNVRPGDIIHISNYSFIEVTNILSKKLLISEIINLSDRILQYMGFSVTETHYKFTKNKPIHQLHTQQLKTIIVQTAYIYTKQAYVNDKYKSHYTYKHVNKII